MAATWPSCPRCGGATAPAEFGPGGTVWSATVVRVAVAGHTPPYALAYVDLDAGPRVLAHVAGPAGTAPPIGSRVRLVPSGDGDLTVTAGTREMVDRGTADRATPAAGTPG